MRRSVVISLAATTLLAAACSGGDDDAGDTAASAPAESDAPTTSPPPTTDPPETTEDSTTTSSTTTTAPVITTSSTTSTTAAPASPTDAAVEAFNRLNELRHQCLAAVQACDPTIYAEVMGEAQLRKAVDQIREWQTAGYVSANAETLREVIREVRPASDDSKRVDIEFCAEDGLVLAIPIQSGTSIVNDEFWSNRLVAQMLLEADGAWRLQSYTQIGATVTGQENSQCR